jgi:hypothetical protein
MPLGGLVHLLLQHPLVGRAHRVLRAAEDLGADLLRVSERELRHRTADPPLDAFRAERDLVVAVAFAPFRRAVRVADRHAHDRDRSVHAAQRDHAGDAAAGADDDAAADLLAEDAVRGADVVASLGRDRRRLQAEAVLADRARGVVDDGVLRVPAGLQREIEAGKVELDPGHVRAEHAQRLLQQFLAGLVALQHHDRFDVHAGGH